MIELSRDWADIPITKCGKLREYWSHQASFLGKTKHSSQSTQKERNDRERPSKVPVSSIFLWNSLCACFVPTTKCCTIVWAVMNVLWTDAKFKSTWSHGLLHLCLSPQSSLKVVTQDFTSNWLEKSLQTPWLIAKPKNFSVKYGF